jgi:hypothetical protein
MSPEREATVSEISYYPKAKSPSPPPAPTRETFFPLSGGWAVRPEKEREGDREREKGRLIINTD